MKNILFCFMTFWFIGSVQAQNICEFNELETMFKAYTLNSIALWEKTINELEKDGRLKSDPEIQLQYAYAHYGLAGTCIGARQKEKGLAASKVGERYAKKLLNNEAYASEGHALLSGLFGLQIAFNPMKGMYLGPKSDKHCDLALKLNEENAFAYLQKGSSLYNTPSMFGGSVEKSVEQFEKAIALYEVEDIPLNLWKMEAQVWLGQAYASLGRLQEAKDIYDDILIEAPDFAWVKSYLLPKLEAKL